jgi:5'-nucleotidase
MHNRRKFLTQTSLTAGALLFLKPMQTFAGHGLKTALPNNTLTLLYTAGLSEQWDRINDAGGIAAVTDAVNRIKRQSSNLVLLDAGNMLAADSKKNIGHLHYFRALKKAGFDAMIPGINDMQHGAAYFSKLAAESRLKAIATTYTTQELITNAVLPHQMITKGTARVGIIGIGANELRDSSTRSASKLIDLVNRTASALKQSHHCNVVICLSHLCLKSEEKSLDNMRLAASTAGVDVIISNNDQCFTYNTHVVKDTTSHDVFVTHSGKKGTLLGRIDITFNEHGDKIHLTTTPVFTGPGEYDIKAAFNRQAARVGA